MSSLDTIRILHYLLVLEKFNLFHGKEGLGVLGRTIDK